MGSLCLIIYIGVCFCEELRSLPGPRDPCLHPPLPCALNDMQTSRTSLGLVPLGNTYQPSAQRHGNTASEHEVSWISHVNKSILTFNTSLYQTDTLVILPDLHVSAEVLTIH